MELPGLVPQDRMWPATIPQQCKFVNRKESDTDTVSGSNPAIPLNPVHHRSHRVSGLECTRKQTIIQLQLWIIQDLTSSSLGCRIRHLHADIRPKTNKGKMRCPVGALPHARWHDIAGRHATKSDMATLRPWRLRSNTFSSPFVPSNIKPPSLETASFIGRSHRWNG